MKKVFLFAALTGLFLASCSNDEFFGAAENTSTTNEIGFGMDVPNLTRGTTGGAAAAQKLNNNFVVYGFKYFDAEPKTKAGVADPTKQQNVFDYYNVNYIGNAGTTKSNTSGWEYVGYNTVKGGDLQTMKYWDYSATGYVFSAISGVGVTVDKIESTGGSGTVYGKGWKVTIPAGGSLSALYASSRVPVEKKAESDVYKYPETVNMTFYSMASKVRFGIYETVPGYSISIDKFYCKNSKGSFTKASNTTTNFGINGKFLTPNVDKATELKVTYYDNTTAVENRPKVTFDEKSVAPANPNSALFGTNMQAQTAIGETSVTATYDKANGEYTFILPYQNVDNNLQLYVDFTLTAANGEKIKVRQAKATVPAAYTQWKENFAYTYLFKISDNTNGTTGTPGDPDDPTVTPPSGPNDPQGLYSITFDACIVNAEEGLTQEGVQEVISSVTTPSITTYAKGTVVTENNEYTADADSVYYSASDNATKAIIDTDNSAVYQVIYNGKAPLTEALIADYNKGNGVMLVPVVTTEATSAPLSDGTKLTFAAKQCKRFKVAAGNNYVVVYTDATTKAKTYKLVRVAGGTGTTPNYNVLMTPDEVQKITELTGSVKWILEDQNNAGNNILGAAKSFVVKDPSNKDLTNRFEIVANGDDDYQLQLKNDSVSTGEVNGEYTVWYGKANALKAFNVDLKYEIVYDPLDASVKTATVVTGGSTYTVTLKVAGVAHPGAKITGVPNHMFVKDNGNGTYTISADKDLEPTGSAVKQPKPHEFCIAGQVVKVEVTRYKLFAPDNTQSWTIDWPEGKTPEETEIEFKDEVNGYGADGVSIASSNTDVHPGFVTTGTMPSSPTRLSVTPNKGGKTIFSYASAELEYTANKWELKGAAENPDETKITRATGSTKLTLWLNDVQQNATTKTVVVKKDDKVITTGFSLTSDGRDLTFGNVVAAGTYMIEYTDGAATPNVLGYEEIEVK